MSGASRRMRGPPRGVRLLVVPRRDASPRVESCGDDSDNERATASPIRRMGTSVGMAGGSLDHMEGPA